MPADDRCESLLGVVDQHGRPGDIKTERPINIYTSDCVATLSEADTFKWWESQRERARRSKNSPTASFTADEQTLRDKLERCRGFDDGEDSENRYMCSNKLLLGAYLHWIDRRKITFLGSKFRGLEGILESDASFANLSHAHFLLSDAAGINLKDAILRGATFSRTNLTEAHFNGADMRSVELLEVTLADADFANADLDDATYEPRTQSLPNISSFASARNLQGLKYQQSPRALSELREALYKAALPDQARKVTFAIEHTGRVLDAGKGDLLNLLSSWARLVAFEWPVGYGMNPFRPLLLLLLFIPIFTPLYGLGIYGGERGRIWIRRSDGAIHQTIPERWTPVWVAMEEMMPRRWWFNAARLALWFSIICAFRIGYRDVNVGDWITRLQPREYLLGATGWCRTISGIQSLLSVYLLALTVLCIIGRPFG